MKYPDYNYSKAMHLIENAYKLNQKVHYDDLEQALGFEHSIEDPEYAQVTKAAIEHLRTKMKNTCSLTFKNAATGNHANPSYYYYTVSKVDRNKTTLKPRTVKEKKEKIVADNNNAELRKQLDAISANNRVLYNTITELEETISRLNEENNKLHRLVIHYKDKDVEYKNIVQSLMRIAALEQEV